MENQLLVHLERRPNHESSSLVLQAALAVGGRFAAASAGGRGLRVPRLIVEISTVEIRPLEFSF